MAEVKNAFIKSKMNKDLDARLVPNGEYRDAKNVQVSRSQGDDVGALENILGNAVTVNGDFATDAGAPNIECIGYVVDESTSFVYLFFTDYTDPYANDVSTYSATAKNFVYAYNILSNQRVKLLQGSFLNFSTNRPIIGANLLENLLFWTDNRNQPRKINIDLATSNGVSYYNTEDKISVAKYNPYQSPELIREVSSNVYETTMYDVATELLPTSGTLTVNGTFTNETEIDVDAKAGFVADGSTVIGDGITPGTVVVDFNEGAGTLEVNIAQDFTDNAVLSFQQPNPYYNANFPGDPQYLEDKFVRFSYRFKFIDGEYSIIAPFTQEAFIPKQDGYFLDGDEKQTTLSTVVDFMENKVNKIDLQIPLPNGTTSDNLQSDYLITDIDIIYKESDSTVVQVVETIPVSSITGNVSTYVYSYVSQKPYKTLPSDEITRVYDKVPVKALGQEVASNRVIYSNFQNKHTPPNFIDYQVGTTSKIPATDTGSSKSIVEYPNHSLKENRNYQVGVVLSDKFGRQSTVILSNNTDDVGVSGVGADTVYLPYNSTNNSISFVGNSIITQFNKVLSGVGIDKDEKTGTPGLYNPDSTSEDYNPLGWYSYKIVVKQTEQEYYNVYIGGAMKGQPYWTNGNPPVTTPQNPLDQNATFVTLLNDNINKVPRDLSEVGAQDKQFRSSAVLFGRVENIAQSFSNFGNKQYIPERRSFTVNQIEDLFDAFDVLQFKGGGTDVIPVTSTNSPYYAFFRSESNPFIAEFVTSTKAEDQFGIVNNGYANQNTVYNRFENLNILETKPTISRLDIYWETSTSGLVSQLNNDIGGNTQAGKIANWTYNHSEQTAPTDIIVSGFKFQSLFNDDLQPSSTPTFSVTDNAGTDRTSEFSLIDNGNFTYNIKPASGQYFYYEQTASLNVFNFVFNVTVGGVTNTVSKPNQALTNIAPTINNDNTDTILVFEGVRDIPLVGVPSGEATGVNGSLAAGGRSTEGLIFSISSQSGVGNFEIDTTDGVSVINTDGTAVGDGSFVLTLEDGGNPVNLFDGKTFNVNFDAQNPI